MKRTGHEEKYIQHIQYNKKNGYKLVDCDSLLCSVEGKTKHYRVICKRNMMFTINEREFFDRINEMVTVRDNLIIIILL